MPFAPIAIVGRSCVLPGALDPSALWELVAAGRDLVGPAPEGRWGLEKDEVLCLPGATAPDAAWSDRGGYVSGFEKVWDPSGFGVELAVSEGSHREGESRRSRRLPGLHGERGPTEVELGAEPVRRDVRHRPDDGRRLEDGDDRVARAPEPLR